MEELLAVGGYVIPPSSFPPVLSNSITTMVGGDTIAHIPSVVVGEALCHDPYLFLFGCLPCNASFFGNPEKVIEALLVYDRTLPGRWKFVHIPGSVRVKPAIVAFGNFVYLIGGQTLMGMTINSVSRFYIPTHEWVELSPMPIPRFYDIDQTQAIYVKGVIFFVAKQADNIYIYRYYPISDDWELDYIGSAEGNLGRLTRIGRVIYMTLDIELENYPIKMVNIFGYNTDCKLFKFVTGRTLCSDVVYWIDEDTVFLCIKNKYDKENFMTGEYTSGNINVNRRDYIIVRQPRCPSLAVLASRQLQKYRVFVPIRMYNLFYETLGY